MKVWVCGSRSAKSYIAIEQLLNEYIPPHTPGLIIGHGDCPEGVDKLVKQWARNYDIETHVLPADWSKGNHMGLLRSEEGIDWADIVFAIWDEKSPGTKHCIEYAEQTGVRVHVVRF